MKEREVEKRVCRTLWEAFNDFYDERSDREDLRLLTDLRDALDEALPYDSREVFNE